MKTLAIFTVSFVLLLATLSVLAQTSSSPAPPKPAATGTEKPAAAAAEPKAATTADTAGQSEAATAADSPTAKKSTEAIVEDETLDAEDVVRKLLNKSRKEAVLPQANVDKSVADTSVVAPPEIVKPLPEPPGAMLVNRLGRMLRDPSGDGWKFHFESDGEILYEPPVSVLPNRVLEAMENILEKAGSQTVLFKITGEVTNYRGQRFVLIRRMIVRRDTGAM